MCLCMYQRIAGIVSQMTIRLKNLKIKFMLIISFSFLEQEIFSIVESTMKCFLFYGIDTIRSLIVSKERDTAFTQYISVLQLFSISARTR